MTGVWPWLAVAGLGALHGLNPAAGWMFAAAWGVRSGERARALRALLPIAAGHAASVALVAGAVALGLGTGTGRAMLQASAGALLVVVAIAHRSGHARRMRVPAGHAGLALWSFMMSTAHGAGMMLVPALVPLCLSDSPAREITASGSLGLALAAVALHTTAMLAVTGAIAAGVCRGARRLRGGRPSPHDALNRAPAPRHSPRSATSALPAAPTRG